MKRKSKHEDAHDTKKHNEDKEKLTAEKAHDAKGMRLKEGNRNLLDPITAMRNHL